MTPTNENKKRKDLFLKILNNSDLPFPTVYARHGGVTALFRFYRNLNDFLPISRRDVSFSATMAMNASIKDAIESLGIPHTEVEAVIVNGLPVGFSYRMQSGDSAAVYPDLDVPGNASLPPLS